jgi:osmotically-inducible protein OsmY
MSQDRHIQQAVSDELGWEPSVDAAHIGVTVHGGVVTLSGHVPSFAEKRAAESAARRVKGVRAVADKIEVRPAHGGKPDDEEVASLVLQRLESNVSIPMRGITATVDNGWVSLTGEVDWHYQREAAERDARAVPGVTAVGNAITIRNKVRPIDISGGIMHALHRSSIFDPRTISVTADGSKVHLTGVAHSLHDKQIAAATAWKAPGVTDVKNDIVVA